MRDQRTSCGNGAVPPYLRPGPHAEPAHVPLYLATVLIFLALDAVVLRLVMQTLFQHHLGDTMRDGVFVAPAAPFYPAMLTGNPLSAAFRGAVVGAMAYGTYEVTSISVMKD